MVIITLNAAASKHSQSESKWFSVLQGDTGCSVHRHGKPSCFVYFSPLLWVDMGTMKAIPEEPKKYLSELMRERWGMFQSHPESRWKGSHCDPHLVGFTNRLDHAPSCYPGKSMSWFLEPRKTWRWMVMRTLQVKVFWVGDTILDCLGWSNVITGVPIKQVWCRGSEGSFKLMHWPMEEHRDSSGVVYTARFEEPWAKAPHIIYEPEVAVK